MTVYSLFSKGLSLEILEVQVQLVAGAAEIKILGLPDAATREAEIRVKAALRAESFEFPAARTVLVQLRPGDQRKTSLGLDLAIAAGILWEMEQLPRPEASRCLLYGEVNLDGTVHTPKNFWLWNPENPELEKVDIITGADVEQVSGAHKGVTRLSELASPKELPIPQPIGWRRKKASDDVYVTPSAARMLSILAVGEHHCILAGPAGSGKTTTLEKMVYLAEPPPLPVADRLRKFHHLVHDCEILERPLIAPHHSVSSNALVGGGSPPQPGEVSRAHGGFLVLDEFLEFSGIALEALREPLQNKRVRISRGMYAVDFPADFTLLATTNLCPCGRFVPGVNTNCVCGGRQRRNYLSRLNGPVLDRLDILAFTDTWTAEKQTIPLTAVLEAVDLGLEQKQKNPDIEVQVAVAHRVKMDDASWRRQSAVQRVARTIGWLQRESAVSAKSYTEALELSLWSFNKLLRSLQS